MPNRFDPARDIWGILFVNMGGPETTTQIKPYLYSIFSDRAIIKLPLSFLLQKPFARLISTLRTPKVAARYNLIGGGSPLLRYDRKLADGVRQTLSAEFPNLHTYVGMRYIEPFIDTQLQQAINDGCKHLLVIPMYPHYCLATTGTALRCCRRFSAQRPSRIDHRCDSSSIGMTCGGYIALLRTRIKQACSHRPILPRKHNSCFRRIRFPKASVSVVIPMSIRLSVPANSPATGMTICFHFSLPPVPVKWVGPDTLATIDKLAARASSN